MFTQFLNAFKTKPENIDVFEQFVVKYEDKDGFEEVFNLLRGKKEIEKNIPVRKDMSSREWYQLIEADFDQFMQELNDA